MPFGLVSSILCQNLGGFRCNTIGRWKFAAAGIGTSARTELAKDML